MKDNIVRARRSEKETKQFSEKTENLNRTYNASIDLPFNNKQL